MKLYDLQSNVMAAALVVGLTSTAPAFAERADRDKPIQVEAQKITVDDAKKTQVLEGNVILTKGTLIIQSDRIVVTEDKYGFQKGVAYAGPGGLARFRQKREGKDEYVDGAAERIEYDTKSEVAELFQRAWIKSGEDQLKGDYIWYDSIAEKYLVTAGQDQKGQPARVRATLLPKNRPAEPEPATSAKKGENLRLQESENLAKPPETPPPPAGR